MVVNYRLKFFRNFHVLLGRFVRQKSNFQAFLRMAQSKWLYRFRTKYLSSGLG